MRTLIEPFATRPRGTSGGHSSEDVPGEGEKEDGRPNPARGTVDTSQNAPYLTCESTVHPAPVFMDLTLHHEHPWDVSPDDAKQIQYDLEPAVKEGPLPETVETVAGVDVSVRDDTAQAAVAVLRLSDLEVVDRAVHTCEVPFPYVPGLLSFREMPAVLPALEQLAAPPDVFMTDSHGRAHPRSFGLACHLGVVLDVPTIGVAKSRLTGTPEGDLGSEKGSRVPLVDDGEVIGLLLRTRTDVNPVYVSVGHRCTVDDAAALTLSCSPRYKIPEPTRQAHRLSREDA